MLNKRFSTKFKGDLKKYQYNKSILKEFNDVLKMLIKQQKLPEKFRDHDLSGNYKGYREYHVKPDVLLVYRTDAEILYLYRIGSHSELF